jgi:hypothetical protein
VTSPEYNGAGALLELGGDNIRDIAINDGNIVWIVSDGGPSSVTTYDYQTGVWAIISPPDNRGQDIAFDFYGRPWVATKGGVYFLDNGVWNQFSHLPALALAFGCTGCNFGPKVLFIAYDGLGLGEEIVPAPISK